MYACTYKIFNCLKGAHHAYILGFILRPKAGHYIWCYMPCLNFLFYFIFIFFWCWISDQCYLELKSHKIKKKRLVKSSIYTHTCSLSLVNNYLLQNSRWETKQEIKKWMNLRWNKRKGTAAPSSRFQALQTDNLFLHYMSIGPKKNSTHLLIGPFIIADAGT